MPKTVPIDEAERNLRELLSSLADDERITIVDEAGVPLGQVSASSGKSEQKEREELDDWMKKMERHARQIDEGWIGDKSALDQLEEDRNRLEDAPRDETDEPK